MVSLKKVAKRGFIFMAVTLLGVTLFANIFVLRYRNYITDDAASISTTTTALVFGGGMKEDGTMSDMQTDRVVKAVELYNTEKVSQLIMTGDDGARRFDEVHAMRQFALDRGVAAKDIAVDPHGYNTYSSCYRARYEYGLQEIVAVSQQFHLPRIMYFCEHFGIKTTGLSADITNYGLLGSLWGMHLRETLARVKGWWQIEVTQPPPLYVTPTSTSLPL